MFYIYLHCKPDGTPFYVGKGKGRRARQFSANRNRHHLNIINKYGKKNIQVVIMPCSSEVEALAQEIGLIKSFRALGFELANKTDGGEGTSGRPTSSETRAKQSAALKGRKVGKFSDEHRANIAAAHIGKRPTLITLIRLSRAKKGVPVSPETAAKISASRTGKKYPRAAKK